MTDVSKELLEIAEKVDCFRMKPRAGTLCKDRSCPFNCRYSSATLPYCAYNNLLCRAAALLKLCAGYHKAQVHNIGNVEKPDYVTEEQFRAVMNNVVEALEHTDRGEMWPYDEKPVIGQAFSPD